MQACFQHRAIIAVMLYYILSPQYESDFFICKPHRVICRTVNSVYFVKKTELKKAPCLLNTERTEALEHENGIFRLELKAAKPHLIKVMNDSGGSDQTIKSFSNAICRDPNNKDTMIAQMS